MNGQAMFVVLLGIILVLIGFEILGVIAIGIAIWMMANG